MAKRVKSIIGNIVMIPVSKDLYGVARTVNKVSDTCLFEMYMAGPFKSKEEINIDDVMKAKKVYSWGYDNWIKNGKWPVIANIVPSEKIEMPYFIRSSYYSDIKGMKIFMQKGNFDMPLEYVGEKKFITIEESMENEAKGIMSGGILFSDTVEMQFAKQLRYNNLI